MKEEMSLNILIIGNGFDLAHNLQTGLRYLCEIFLEEK